MSNNITSEAIKVARERVNRAWEHIENFNLEVNNFLAINPYDTISDIHMEGQEYVVSFRFRVKQPVPIRARLIASDVIHNLDSILDNISYPLTKHSFPLFNCADSFEKEVEPWLAKKPIEVSKLIRGLQPYNTGNPDEHQLRILRRLSSGDKHKIPILLGCISPSLSYSRWGGMKDIRLKRMSRAQYLKDSTEIAAWASSNLKVIQDLHTHYRFDVTFGKVRVNIARDLLVELHNFIRDEVITKFEPFMTK